MNNTKVRVPQIKSLLNDVSNLKHQDERIRKIKGEDFNLFSIMRMETNENNTHSNIIGELLDPRGSHHMGDVFLDSFLIMIYKNQKKLDGKSKKVIDIDSLLKTTTPKLSLEYHIGFKDDILKTGGRIDILIEFGDLHSITIENKINAGDQHLQLKRYHNFRKGNNDVFYLTKHGTSASESSMDDLSEDDIYIISYETHIKEWIEQSLQLATQQPILRESLKQYLLLIKKITFQMEDELKQQMNELLKNDLRTASTIYHNYFDAKNSVKREIKNEVFNRLQSIISDFGLQIIDGSDVNQKFSQIWLHTEGVEKPLVSFGIESFSGNHNSHHRGQMMIGINNATGSEEIAKEIRTDCKEWFGWPEWITLTNSDNESLNLSDLDTLDLFMNTETREANIDIIVNGALELIKKYHTLVNEINLRA